MNLLDTASAYFLNMNGRDRGADYLGNPDELAMLQTPLSPMVPFNGKAPNLMETEISTVPDLAGVAPMGNVLPVQNIQNDLRQLRAEMPFLPIIKRPSRVVSLFLVQNVAQDIEVKSSDALFRFNATTYPEFWVCFDGRAVVPTLANPNTGSIVNPLGVWYYAGMVNQISIVTPSATDRVSIEFIGREEQP
jgi:hypothetical protein